MKPLSLQANPCVGPALFIRPLHALNQRLLRLVCSVLLGMVLVPDSWAQGSFLAPAATTKAQLNIVQRTAVEKFERSASTKAVQFVRLNSWADSQKDGFYHLTLPGESKARKFQPKMVSGLLQQNYQFIGNAVDSVGQVLLTAHGGIYRGLIDLGIHKYELVHVGEGLYAYLTLKTDSEGSCGTSQLTTAPTPTRPRPSGGREDACLNPLRILVVYTQEAANNTPDIQGLVNLSIASFNATLQNSAINASVQYVRGGLISNFSETFNTSSGLTEVNNFASAVQTRREGLNADLAICITGNDYGANSVEHFVGAAQGTGPNTTLFAAITQADAAISNFTFSHELGHLFGAQHHDCTHAPNTLVGEFQNQGCFNYVAGQYNYGFHFERNHNRYHTVMHYNWAELDQGGVFSGGPYIKFYGTTINYFSNPDISYDQCAIGNAEHNNARAVRDNASGVANNRTSGLGYPSADIQGTYGGYTNESPTWEAIYSCGPGPYQFEWRTSYNGGASYGQVEGTGEQFTWSLANYYPTLNLWLRVIAPNGQVADAFRTVGVQNPGPGVRIAATGGAEPEPPAETDFQVLAPNPTPGSFRVTFTLNESLKVRFRMVTSTGNTTYLSDETAYPAGTHTQSFRVTGLAPGLHTVQLLTSQRTLSRKVLLQP